MLSNDMEEDHLPKTQLHHAIKSGHKDLVEQLLAKGAVVNKTYISKSPLHYAVESQHVHIIELLLAHGANINITDVYKRTPLQYAVQSKSKDIVKLLLAQGADTNISDVCNNTPLHYAVLSENKDIVEQLLTHGAMVDVNYSRVSKSPLHYAIQLQRKDIVELLLVCGANIEAIDTCNKNPLFYAVESRNKDMIELLLARGANVDISDLLSYARFENLAELRNDDIGWLLAQRLDFNRNDDRNRVPLHYASQLGRNDIVELLLSQGAKVNGKNKYGKVPMYYAVKWGRKDTVELLLAQGAKVNITDDCDNSLLYHASEAGHRAVVELLLHHRSNPNFESNGDTALSIAAQFGKTKVVKYMIENKDTYKILINKVPIMKYYIGKPKMEKFLFRNGVIPEPEKNSEARIMKILTRDGQGVHTSYEIKRIKFFVKKLKDVQQNYSINEINEKTLELSEEFKLLSCKNVELFCLTESEKRNLLTPLREHGNKNYYDYMMNCTPQQLLEVILLQTINTLNKWLTRDERGVYTCPKSIHPLEYDSNDNKGKITLPELLGRLRLLIDREPNLVEKRELCATFFEKNADCVTAKLAKIQEVHPKFTSDQVTKKSIVHELLSSLDDGQVSNLYNLVSNENINEILKQQKLFVLAKGIYGTSIIYGHNQEGCLVGTFHHLVNVIEEISYNFSDEYQDCLVEEQKTITDRKEIDESNVRNLVRSVAKNILETVDNMSEATQNMLQDHILHITPITSALSNPSRMTFEQQKLFVVLNENILDKLFEVVPDYDRAFPTNHELKLIVDNLYTDQLFQKWADKPEESVENTPSKKRKKETK